MSKRGKYAGYQALDPFFAIIQEGLTGLVDGEHFTCPSPPSPEAGSKLGEGRGGGACQPRFPRSNDEK